MDVVAEPLSKKAGGRGGSCCVVGDRREQGHRPLLPGGDGQRELRCHRRGAGPDFVDGRLLPGQEPDREGYKRSIAEMNAPFSNIRITIDEQVAEGDKVAT